MGRGRPARILSEEEAKDLEAEVSVSKQRQLSATQAAVAELVEDVERLVSHGGMTLAEALVDYAQSRGDHDLEAAASLVRRSKDMKSRLEAEAGSRRMLKTPHGATRIEEDEEPVAFACEECGREFPTAFGLGIHMSRGHKIRKRVAA
jgi:hypothetical protein